MAEFWAVSVERRDCAAVRAVWSCASSAARVAAVMGEVD